ncbi:MAG: hypothetical protein L6R41_008091 [Letrouitia leprolyta]|nr:MAG: hypothetical protein L6R41_008091 [Letrouitia leprolyta]
MKSQVIVSLVIFCAASHAAPTNFRQLKAREVPQEHSHESILTSVRDSLAIDNPDDIQDPVFGLLGNAAAAAGQGSITDTDCLHQATADQAFTNAKAAGDVAGMTNALIYAALERNTGKVGLASVKCTAIKATNAEIGAISQHQDPASAGAAATNKAVTLTLAKQIASVGGDPQEALKAGTFAPGDVNDPTAKGNSCDDQNDKEGCIFTQNLLVPDATADEIAAAAGSGMTGAAATGAGSTEVPTPAMANSTGATNAAASFASNSTAAPSASTGTAVTASGGGDNIQTFTGTLGGAPPPVIKSSGDRPFSVNGNTFVNTGAALQRSCAIQHNACADAANSGKLAGGVGQCDAQEKECNAAASISSDTTAASSTSAGTANTGPSSATPSASSSADGENVQTFTGALGGAPPPVIKSSGDRPFSVNGNTFVNSGAALQRSCAIQHNACANATNSGKLGGGVGQCDAQEKECNATAGK